MPGWRFLVLNWILEGSSAPLQRVRILHSSWVPFLRPTNKVTMGSACEN